MYLFDFLGITCISHCYSYSPHLVIMLNFSFSAISFYLYEANIN